MTRALQQNFIFPFPVFLDVCGSWVKLDSMGVTCRAGIISSIYIKGDIKDIANDKPISLLNLDYEIYITNFKNRMQNH